MFSLPLFIELSKTLSYTLLSLNCRWFTFAIPLARALEVVLSSCRWHPIVPCVSRRILFSQGDNSDSSDYTPLCDPDDSDSEPDPVRAATEFCSFSEESSMVPAQLHGLLFQLGITRTLKYRANGVTKLVCMEFTCTIEFFDGQEVVSKHACPTPHATCAVVVVDAAWQALMSWNCSWHHDLKNCIYAIYPRRKKSVFKISRGNLQIFRGAMSHSTSLSLDLSGCLVVAQTEIHYLCTRLADTEDTMRAHQMMQTGQDSDFYSLDQDT
jgi:hypothetical protein